MSLLGLSSLVVPLLVVVLLRCLSKSKSKSKRRLRHKAEQQAKRSLNASIQEQQYLIANVDASRREEAMEFLNKWGFVRAGLQRRDLHGLDTYEMRVLEFLEGSASSAPLLGISGMRGIGKSTLLRLIYHTYSDYRPFDYIFHLQLDGDECTVATFHSALAWTIGLDPQISNNAPLASQIISGRLKDQTFLLLLDDVPAGGIDLAAIGLPMPLSHRQKVVFTARDQAVCANMGCAASDTIHMQCLGEDDAWDLFRCLVGEKIISYDSEIEDLAKQMVAECRGIPRALCTVGLAMSNQSDCIQWRVAYEMLMIKPPPTNEIQDKSDEGYPRLKYFE